MNEAGGDPCTLERLLRARRSIRGFLPDPVPGALLERVFTMAGLAPSNCNVQPWVVHIVSGDAAERMRTALYEAAVQQAVADPDIQATGAYPGEYRTRQIDAARALFAATGVARGDNAARLHSFRRNFRFFDAPHAAFIFMPDWCSMREASDCGMYAQSLMLAMTAHGLASCAQGALSLHAGIVRRQLAIGGNLILLFGVAFGYADMSHPANTARTARAPLAETTKFHS